jgi:hypothetical protein
VERGGARVPRASPGFSLVEVLVAGLVLVVGLIALSQFFASAVGRVLDSDVRSVLHQVAAREMERIRGLPYADVGTTDGHPVGVLAPDEEVTEDITKVHIHREVVYWTDESYDDEGPYPANYRRVTVLVSAADRPGLSPVEMVSNIAGGATGGTLLVKVQDSQGQPVQTAQLTIVNDVLVPPVNVTSTALRTNELGVMLVPGLKVDPSGNYVVTATKSGYNADEKTGFAVLEASLQEVVLTIDLVSAMTVHVIDETTGLEVPGVGIAITGPAGYSNSITSQDGGVTLTDLRFATSAEPYILTLLPGYGVDEQQQSIELPAGSGQEVVFYVTPGSATTTTTLSPVTTTTLVATTTTIGTGGSLLVKVVRAGTMDPLRYAWVNLEGRTGYTNVLGEVLFSNLDFGTYGIEVSRTYYASYSGTVTVDGAETLTVELTYTGGWPSPH